ncbi:hypothetical protein GCM10020256_17210 [Streptomyces thermocoprophilus]
MPDALDATPYDALLLLSFGGPEGPDDVVPFLENVTRGRGIPKERLKEVGQHYFLFGGVSPINDQNRALLDALRKDFADHGLDLPVYWGNRNWAPYLTDTLREMVRDGRRRVLVLATSAYASYSGCRQYRENLADAIAALQAEGLEPPKIDKLRHYFNHPGFVEPMTDGVLRSLADLPEELRDGAHIAFTTHSIPTTAADTSGPVEGHGDGGAYVRQHLDVARLIADAVRERTGVDHPWQLVYQSRSGAPHIPWLEPDICDHLEERHAAGVPAVVMAPHRLRLRPHGSPVRPRHRSHGQGRRTGSSGTAFRHRGRRPALRRGGPRPDPGTRPGGARRTGHPLRPRHARREPRPVPGRLLPGPRPPPRSRGRGQPLRVRRPVIDPLHKDLLEIAREAALRAGDLLRDGRPADLGVADTKSSPVDVVTEMDIAAEKLITGLISERRPDDGFLGEEGASVEGSTGIRWVIDPLDGTVNYLYGLPTWAVSIAAEQDGETVAGVVFAPMRGRRTTRCAAAARGRPAPGPANAG